MVVCKSPHPDSCFDVRHAHTLTKSHFGPLGPRPPPGENWVKSNFSYIMWGVDCQYTPLPGFIGPIRFKIRAIFQKVAVLWLLVDQFWQFLGSKTDLGAIFGIF